MIKKLVVREFVVENGDMSPDNALQPGERYSYFYDPETGKYYRPVEGFTVTAMEGTDLSDKFIEVD